MKRYILLLIFVFIFLLSGCKVSRFEYGSSRLSSMREIEDIIEVMLDEGNYDENLKVPFNRTGIYLSYIDSLLLVESIHFNVYTDFDGELYHFDTTSCFNENGTLLCKETSDSRSDSETLKDEIKLIYAFELFISVDAIEIITELRREFTIPPSERIIIQYHLKDVESINEDIDRYENRVFYYNNEFHYDNSYTPDDMMIEIRVDFINAPEGVIYIVYIEID